MTQHHTMPKSQFCGTRHKPVNELRGDDYVNHRNAVEVANTIKKLRELIVRKSIYVPAPVDDWLATRIAP